MSSNLSTMRPPNLIIISLTSLVSFQAFLFNLLQTKQDLLFTFVHFWLFSPHLSLSCCSLVLGECCDTSRGLCEACGCCQAAGPGPGAANSLPPSGVRSRSQSLPSVSQLSQSNFCFLSIPYFFTNVTCQAEGSRIKNADDLSQIIE